MVVFATGSTPSGHWCKLAQRDCCELLGGCGAFFQLDWLNVLGSMLASDGFSAIVERVIDSRLPLAPLILPTGFLFRLDSDVI